MEKCTISSENNQSDLFSAQGFYSFGRASCTTRLYMLPFSLLIHKCILHIIISTLLQTFFWHKLIATVENLEKYKHYKKEVKVLILSAPRNASLWYFTIFCLKLFPCKYLYISFLTFRAWSIYSFFLCSAFSLTLLNILKIMIFYVCTRFHCMFTPIFIHPNWCYFQCFGYYKQPSDAFFTSIFKFLSLWSQKIIFWRWIWVFSWLQVETAILTARKAPLTQCPWTWLRPVGRPQCLWVNPSHSLHLLFSFCLVWLSVFFLELS